jgi:hypothetical protein
MTKPNEGGISVYHRRPTPAKETSVELFGSKTDPDVQRSINKVAITGRKINLSTRPSFDTGLGQCGKHLCSCKHACAKQYAGVSFPGDNGASMGQSF